MQLALASRGEFSKWACRVGAVPIIVNVFSAHGAVAAEPRPWQLGLQDAASPVMEMIAGLNSMLTVVIVGITALVLVLILFAAWRYSARRHPVASRTTHNARLEVLWTVVPALILTVIAVPSLRLLYYIERTPEAEMTLKVTSHQWYWSYEYLDHDGLAFDSLIVPDEQLKPGQPRLLAVDNPAVLPVGATIRVVVTSSDVLHGFAVPALGVKIDTVPGRLNERWIRIDKPGTYYGQCSELCGVGHAFMPIGIKAVAKDEFATWVKAMRDKLAARPATGPVATQETERLPMGDQDESRG